MWSTTHSRYSSTTRALCSLRQPKQSTTVTTHSFTQTPRRCVCTSHLPLPPTTNTSVEHVYHLALSVHSSCASSTTTAPTRRVLPRLQLDTGGSAFRTRCGQCSCLYRRVRVINSVLVLHIATGFAIRVNAFNLRRILACIVDQYDAETSCRGLSYEISLSARPLDKKSELFWTKVRTSFEK